MRIRSLIRRLRPVIREARLRPEYSDRFPRIRAGRWLRVRTVLRRYPEYGEPGAPRLPASAFEFRGGAPPRNPAWPMLRQRAADGVPEPAWEVRRSSPSPAVPGLPWQRTGD
jgi:hypothetical protein